MDETINYNALKHGSFYPECDEVAQHFNYDDFMSKIDNDRQLFARFVAKVVPQFRDDLAEISVHHAKGDKAALKKTAHRFRGAALNLTCKKLALILLKIESLPDDQKIKSLIKEAQLELIQIFSLLSDAIENPSGGTG